MAKDTEYMSRGTVNRSVHNKVQLWKDGPYWADTNIGAEKPEDFARHESREKVVVYWSKAFYERERNETASPF